MEPHATASLDVLLQQQGRIRGLARRLVRDAAAADDLVQEALLAALRRPATVHGDANGEGRGFASRVIGNLARDRARRERRRSRHELDGAKHEALPGASEAVVAAERQRALVDAVLALDDPYRTVVLLRFFEELPPREIVRRTGLSAEAVKKQLQRGLAKLRQRLEAAFGRDGAWAVALLPLAGPRAVRFGALVGGAALARRAAFAVVLLGGAGLSARALWPLPDPPVAALAQTERRDAAGAAAAALTEVTPSASRMLAGSASAPNESLHGATTHATTHAMPDAMPDAMPGAMPDAMPDATPGPTPRPGRFDPPFRAQLVDHYGQPLAARALAGLVLEFRYAAGWAGTDGRPEQLVLRPDAAGWIGSSEVPDSGGSGVGTLGVTSGDYAVLAIGRSAPDASEARVVLMPAVRVAGTVLDAHGAPAAGVPLQLFADLPSLGTYPGGLAATDTSPRRRTTTDREGRFDLGRVPRHGRFELEADAGQGCRAAIPVPERDRADLVLRLPAPRAATEVVITGRVIEANGAPVPGAQVQLGWLETLTDEGGSFELQQTRERLEAIEGMGCGLSAVAADGRFAHTAFSTAQLGARVLRVPASMASLGARVVDALGAPVTGAEVFVYDGTPRGASSATLERGGAVRTDADGRFELAHLEQRPYTLRLIRAAPFFVFDVPGVMPGAESLTIRVPDGHMREGVHGRALNLRGQPLAGVQVQLLAYETQPAPARSSTLGPAVLTDALGWFTLAHVPSAAAVLRFRRSASEAHGDTQLDVEGLDLSGPFEVRLDLACDVMPTLREGAIGARLRFLAEDGRRVNVTELVPNGQSWRADVPQHTDGTFGRLLVSQRATRVEVRASNGAVLRVVELDLSPLVPTRPEL